MKRTRRVSIEIEQRNVTFSFTHTAPPETASGAGTEGSVTALEPALHPPVCPDCGAPWITVTAQGGEVGASGPNAIYRALKQHGLHLHVSPTGQLRICSKSFEEIRTDELKEKF